MSSRLLEILKDYQLTGSDLLIEDCEEEKPQEKTTESGLILTSKVDNTIGVNKAKVIKAGKGHYTDNGAYIENPIKEGAEIYYKNAGEYEIEGIKFKGIQGARVVAYKNGTRA